MTMTIDDRVYDGLPPSSAGVTSGKFLENLARPFVVADGLYAFSLEVARLLLRFPALPIMLRRHS